jgi:murein DD-endopeptidase MepM/ murein hydrolase activator NlpD
MKPTTVALLIIAFVLSACTTRASQGIDSQSQTPPTRSVRTETLPSEQLPASYLARSAWGGFHLNSAGSLLGNFSHNPARSVWGGFPLNPALIAAAKPSLSVMFSSVSFSSQPSSSPPSSSDPSCEPTEDFCIIQHSFSFQQPFSSAFNTAIESSYLYGTTEFGALAPHHGVEILNPTGTPVLAVADGRVVAAGSDVHDAYGPWENFYGNLVVLEHHLPDIEEQVYTLYGHLSTIQVQVGQAVEAGELLGDVGATGRAIGSHLHFEVRMGTNQYTSTRNPALWFFPRKDEDGQQYGALAGKLDNAQGNPIYSTLKAEYYPDINGSPDNTFYIETYATDIDPIGNNDTYQENFALPDLPPGWYRIALNASGKWTERWVEVEPGKLSFVTIVSR